jgi:hypothetical protein
MCGCCRWCPQIVEGTTLFLGSIGFLVLAAGPLLSNQPVLIAVFVGVAAANVVEAGLLGLLLRRWGEGKGTGREQRARVCASQSPNTYAQAGLPCPESRKAHGDVPCMIHPCKQQQQTDSGRRALLLLTPSCAAAPPLNCPPAPRSTPAPPHVRRLNLGVRQALGRMFGFTLDTFSKVDLVVALGMEPRAVADYRNFARDYFR